MANMDWLKDWQSDRSRFPIKLSFPSTPYEPIANLDRDGSIFSRGEYKGTIRLDGKIFRGDREVGQYDGFRGTLNFAGQSFSPPPLMPPSGF